MSVTRHRRGRDERGQVVVIFAIFLVVLVLFAAVVFDAGALYLEQRQDVAAADAGVLAGGTKLLIRTTLNKDQIGRDAVETARLNLRPAPSTTAWDTLFAGCTDGARDTALYPSGNSFRPILVNGSYTDCVHFNVSFTKIRIRIPDQILTTSFSRLAGINTMRTYAVAEATISQPQVSNRVMPFSTLSPPGAGTQGDLLCFVLDGQNCGNYPTNQGIRVLDAPLFGGAPATLTTALNCGSMYSATDSTPNADMTTDDRAAANAALGVDHPLLVKGSEPKRGDDCGAAGGGLRIPTPLPNTIYATQFPNLANVSPTGARRMIDGLAQGLAFSGATTFSDANGPRFYRFPKGAAWPTTWPSRVIVKGGTNYTVDDRPLWDFIRPNATGIPATCARSGFVTVNPSDPDNTGPTIGHMANCLNAWINGGYSTPLFDYQTTGPGTYTSCVTTGAPCDIQFSTRAGVVPVVTPAGGGGNFPPSVIDNFQMAFIQILFTSADANRACPCVEYSAGAAPTGAIVEIAGIGGFGLKDLMLPAQARPQPTNSLPGVVSLYR